MAALQRQVFTLLLALIVVSGTLVAYLGYESYHLGKDIDVDQRPVVQPYKQKLPAIDKFYKPDCRLRPRRTRNSARCL